MDQGRLSISRWISAPSRIPAGTLHTPSDALESPELRFSAAIQHGFYSVHPYFWFFVFTAQCTKALHFPTAPSPPSLFLMQETLRFFNRRDFSSSQAQPS